MYAPFYETEHLMQIIYDFLRFKEEVAKALENFEDKEDVHIKEVNRGHMGFISQPYVGYFLTVHGNTYVLFLFVLFFYSFEASSRH